MNMTKNPLALAGGVIVMLFGLSIGLFLGYNVFLEEKMYRKSNESVMGTIVEREEQKIYPPLSAEATKPSTSTATPSDDKSATSDNKSAKATKTTTPPLDEPMIRYNLHYSFTPAGATEPVTSVLNNTTKRLFEAVKENDKLEVIYVKTSPKENHRALFPYEFGKSFYGGIGALFAGAFFITYLGWCFIFPED